MMSRRPTRLFNRATEQVVAAEILNEISRDELIDVHLDWQPARLEALKNLRSGRKALARELALGLGWESGRSQFSRLPMFRRGMRRQDARAHDDLDHWLAWPDSRSRSGWPRCGLISMARIGRRWRLPAGRPPNLRPEGVNARREQGP